MIMGNLAALDDPKSCTSWGIFNQFLLTASDLTKRQIRYGMKRDKTS